MKFIRTTITFGLIMWLALNAGARLQTYPEGTTLALSCKTQVTCQSLTGKVHRTFITGNYIVETKDGRVLEVASSSVSSIAYTRDGNTYWVQVIVVGLILLLGCFFLFLDELRVYIANRMSNQTIA